MPRYFILYLIGFWVPILLLMLILWPRLDKYTRKALWFTLLFFCFPSAIVMEYVYLWADVWTFSEAWDPLLGWRIFGAPVEEFVFWFGAPWLIMLFYLSFDLLDKKFLRQKQNA